MTANDPIRHRYHKDLPVLLKLESWSNDPEVVGFMPDIPVYPNKETAEFIERFYSTALPYDFSHQMNISRELTQGIHIHSHITIPDFEHEKVSTLIDRVEKFIEGELQLIKHGY